MGLYSGLDYGNPQQNRFEVILATYTAHELRQKIGYETE